MELTDHIRNICYRHWIQQQHRVELEKDIEQNEIIFIKGY